MESNEQASKTTRAYYCLRCGSNMVRFKKEEERRGVWVGGFSLMVNDCLSSSTTFSSVASVYLAVKKLNV